MKRNSIRNSFSSSYHRFVRRGIAGITAASRVLPNFIIIGTVRSGTTSLYYNICEHPSVLPAAYDEIGFFDSNYNLGIEWYRSMFPKQKEIEEIREKTGFAITGEDTPFYFWKKEVVERMYKLLPKVKLIVIFRNPVDRAYSNYNLGVRMNTEKSSFEETIGEEMKFLENNSFRESVDRRRSYIAKGIYEKQIKFWFDVFPKKQIHILSTEEMEQNPQETLLKIFRFLGIPEYNIKNPQRKKYTVYEKMNIETRKKLLRFYHPYNEKFFDIIDKRFDWEN